MVLCLIASVAQAQPPAKPQANTPDSRFRDEVRFSLETSKSEILRLADAVPAEKYDWRPGQGVRSVGEVYVHIANGNRLLMGFLRATPPSREEFNKMVADNQQKEKSLKGKAQIIADLKQSFDEVEKALDSTSAAEADRAVKAFGRDTTVRGIFILITRHASEHLGQSIAYARMNGIVPPWSAGGQ
jgi:uncharacterized damage-inducible protein DinB